MSNLQELLNKNTPLSVDECLRLVQEVGWGGADNPWPKKVVGRLAVEQIFAVKRFDEASSILSKRLYWLTWGLFLLTVVIAVFTVLLWWKP